MEAADDDRSQQQHTNTAEPPSPSKPATRPRERISARAARGAGARLIVAHH
ncbi:MAG: hypothetical protein M3P85_13690 [Actinomycetota bacterium]|nr:hypothetical protein [Actinomycetota bacterium]